MSLNSPRTALREAVVPMFVLLLLERHGPVTTSVIHLFLDRNGLKISPRVLRRILQRLVRRGLCERADTPGKHGVHSYASTDSTYAAFEYFLQQLTDFGHLAEDYRDGYRHFQSQDTPLIF
jgi:DNA-binding HxlR family transcriptional regulator